MIIKLEATYTDQGQPWGFSAQSENLESYAAAQELAALFPQTLRARAVECSTAHGSEYYVRISAALKSTGTTGAVNETSQRRIRSLFRALDRMSAEQVWRAPYGNSYLTREEFEAAAL